MFSRWDTSVYVVATKCSTTILPLQVLVSFTYNPATCLDDCFIYQNMLNWHIPLHTSVYVVVIMCSTTIFAF